MTNIIFEVDEDGMINVKSETISMRALRRARKHITRMMDNVVINTGYKVPTAPNGDDPFSYDVPEAVLDTEE